MQSVIGKLKYILLFFGGMAFGGNAQGEFDDQLISVTLTKEDTASMSFVKTPDLFVERWDTLAQPSFWKFVMRMSSQTCILNVAATRQVLELKTMSV